MDDPNDYHEPLYQFEDEWHENTDIGWWNAGRKSLNVAIRAYNQWQLDGMPTSAKRLLLAIIEQKRQELVQVDGGSGWVEILDRMKLFVNKDTEPCSHCGGTGRA